MNEGHVLDAAGDIQSLRTGLAQAPTALAKLEVAKAIQAARETAALPPALVGNDVAVPLEPLLVEWTPRFRSSMPPEFRTLPRRNQHLLFTTGVDLAMMQLTASATLEGQKAAGADRAASDIAKIKACEAAGYMRQRVKLAGLNTLGFVFVKDGLAVSPEGAAKLAGLDAPARAVSKVRVTKSEARNAYDELSNSITSYKQHHDSELLRADVPGILGPKMAAVRDMIARGWPADTTGDPEYLLQSAQGILDKYNSLKSNGLTNDMGRGEARDYLRNNGMTPEQIEAVVANPTSVNTSGMHEVPQYTMAYLNESLKAAEQEKSTDQQEESEMQNQGVAGGSRRWLVTNMLGYRAEHQADTMVEAIQQAMNGSDYTLPSRDWSAVEITGGGLHEPEPADQIVVAVVTTDDQAYLQSIIDGTIDLLDPGIYDKLEPLFTKYADDAEMMGLLNRAAEAYTAAAVAAAKGA